jgi:hypothetical protein
VGIIYTTAVLPAKLFYRHLYDWIKMSFGETLCKKCHIWQAANYYTDHTLVSDASLKIERSSMWRMIIIGYQPIMTLLNLREIVCPQPTRLSSWGMG